MCTPRVCRGFIGPFLAPCLGTPAPGRPGHKSRCLLYYEPPEISGGSCRRTSHDEGHPEKVLKNEMKNDKMARECGREHNVGDADWRTPGKIASPQRIQMANLRLQTPPYETGLLVALCRARLELVREYLSSARKAADMLLLDTSPGARKQGVPSLLYSCSHRGQLWTAVIADEGRDQSRVGFTIRGQHVWRHAPMQALDGFDVRCTTED